MELSRIINSIIEPESIEKGYSDLEIEDFEAKNNISFPNDYRIFLSNISKAKSKSVGTFVLESGREIYGFGEFLSFADNQKKSYTTLFTETKVAIEDYEKLYRFGDSAYGFSQFFYIGVKEPFIDQIFVWHFEDDSGDESFLGENDILLYPKYLVANSFSEFLDFLIQNLSNNRIGE